ncbi:MAG: selB [Solirubrobacterales bacterium]|nr:selB [Solirubrobacterales bacterium]
MPGHERFVRTMVAGATGIDLFLMVVAADDGVMPQTREHRAVLAGLGVSAGVVAVTKSDLGPVPEGLGELFGDCEVVPCSARTGAGIAEVKAALDRVVAGLPRRAIGGDVVLHVDRVFSVRGAGTVVTGTLWSGSVGEGDVVRVLPEGREVRVRSVEVHDARVASADAGQRVALNLVGLGVDEVRRGDVVADGELAASYVLDVALGLRVEHGTRLTVHHGTRETPARVAWLGGRFHQLRCEQPLIAAAGDRLVVRSIAPPDTLGGGVVLDPAARKHGPSRDVLARLERLARGEPADVGPETVPERHRLPPKALDGAAVALEERLRGEAPVLADVDGAAFAALREHGRAVRVGPFAYHAEVLAGIERRVVAVIEGEGAITLARLRDELETSRRYAQALLEHFDAARVTRRLPDDSRVLRRRSGSSGSGRTSA